MKLTSRHRVVAVVAAAMCLLAGCSGAPAAQQSSGGATRTVTNIDGTTVEVPEHPQRIVTLSEPTTDGVLALGLTPVGVVSGRGQSTVSNYLADLAADIPLLGSIAQPNYEAIGAAAPDLILVDGTSINNNAEAIETLQHIAPTVYTGYAGGDWRKNFELVADAVNAADAGTAVLAEYDAHVADVAGQLADAGFDDATFSIVRWQGASAALILLDLPPGQALSDLGLSRPENQDHRGRGHADPVSLENLATIDADYLFFGTLGGSSVDNPLAGGGVDGAAAQAALEEAVQTPGFTALTAYREGHVIPVDGSTWTSTGGPILMNAIVDDVQQALLSP
jgi:iron complex transport system substrate-binding protein